MIQDISSIIQNPLEQREKLRDALGNLLTWVYQDSVRDVLGKELMAQVRQYEQQIRGRLDAEFSLVVLGEFKRGKSTFVNALLKKELMPMNVTPETMTINQIRYGSQLRVEATFKDGLRLLLNHHDIERDNLINKLDSLVNPVSTTISAEDLAVLHDKIRAFLLESDAFRNLDQVENFFDVPTIKPWRHILPEAQGSRQSYVRAFFDSLRCRFNEKGQNALVLFLRVIANDIPKEDAKYGYCLSLASELEAKEPPFVQGISNAISSSYFAEAAERGTLLYDETILGATEYITIEAPVPWLQDMVLVDTPGMGDILPHLDELVESYLPKADAVIYVTSKQFLLSETEQAFLERSLAPLEFGKVLFVVNRMDEINTEREAQKIRQAAEGKIGRIFPQAQIFYLSGLDEHLRQQSEPHLASPRSERLALEFDRFRETLDSSVLLNRDVMQLERAKNQMLILLNKLTKDVTQIREAIKTDRTALAKAIIQFEKSDSELHLAIQQEQERLQIKVSELQQQAETWLSEFLMRLSEETVPSLGYSEFDDIQRHFHFFLTDALTTAVQNCWESQQPLILNSLQKTQEAIQADIDQVNLRWQTEEIQNALHSLTTEDMWKSLDFWQKMSDQRLAAFFRFTDHRLLLLKRLVEEGSRRLSARQKRRRFGQRFKESLPDLEQALFKELAMLYEQLANELKNHVETAYEPTLEAYQATLIQAQQLQENEISRHDALSVLHNLEQLLNETRQKLH